MTLGRTLFEKPIHRVEKQASGWLLDSLSSLRKYVLFCSLLLE
ncbi:hypothetical protein QBO96_20955 [Lysinibacillus capsici]|uniref:Uncharacterized protein n=1 Tax=Lysinibacillus capsici TaxID=2115968 RepID=A0ABY8KK71_9BACI|nr:hypothetical protein [Lysinibacillus capsici]WGF38161.1 hypothetical protein QBO96_20955 [Lysinibacillus capsici]